jgi:hypothetical protein
LIFAPHNRRHLFQDLQTLITPKDVKSIPAPGGLGQRNPTIVTLWHISEALGVRLQSFFKEAKPRRGAANIAKLPELLRRT